MKRADAILCSDLHLREDIPACRTDEFFGAMEEKLGFISTLQCHHDCPVICAGDVFNTWRCSIELVIWAYNHLPNRFICVAGQHELPYHRIDQLHRSPLMLLHKAGRIRLLIDEDHMEGNMSITGISWGGDRSLRKNATDVIVMHEMVWTGEAPFPGAPEEGVAIKVLDNCELANLVVTGDNHQSFEVSVGNRRLINPGSMMRSSVDQADFHPAVFLWYQDECEIERRPLPIRAGVVDVASHVSTKERDARVAAFVEKLGKTDVTLDFNQNLQHRLASTSVPDEVRAVVTEFIEKSKDEV